MFENPAQAERCALLRRVKTIAVVGLSPNPARPSHAIAAGMQKFGFNIIPVRPAVTAVLGQKAYGRLSDVDVPIDLVNVFRAAEHVDQMVLFSGDGDFRSLVEAVQRRGVRVTVVSTISSQPPMIADELRRQADVFTDLVELQSKLSRDPSERPAPREPRHHAPQLLQRATTMAPRGDDDDFDD